MTVWRQVFALPSGPCSALGAARRLVVLSGQLEPHDGDSEQGERDEERPKRVRHVHMIGSGLKPWEESWKTARGREPIDSREREEHDAEKASDQRHSLGHGAGLTEGRDGGKSLRPAGVASSQDQSKPPRAQRK